MNYNNTITNRDAIKAEIRHLIGSIVRGYDGALVSRLHHLAYRLGNGYYPELCLQVSRSGQEITFESPSVHKLRVTNWRRNGQNYEILSGPNGHKLSRLSGKWSQCQF